jgi:arsenite methyltransferase
VPKRLRRLLKDVHEDVLVKFYGCGSPLPEGLEGCTVLDLGCGSGRDCFVGKWGGDRPIDQSIDQRQ